MKNTKKSTNDFKYEKYYRIFASNKIVHLGLAFLVSTIISATGYMVYQNKDVTFAKATTLSVQNAIKAHLGYVPYKDPLSTCPAYTADAGIRSDAYIDGIKFTTRLCAVYDAQNTSFLVSPIIAANLRDFLSASNSSGNWGYIVVRGAGQGFRTAAQQAAVCASGRSTACNNNSMHQAGLAVDVSCAVSADHVLGNNQGTGRQPLDACWPWVSANSYRFALLDQYATHPESWAEGWHLSPDSK